MGGRRWLGRFASSSFLAADQEYTALLPIPYFVCRGERIKVDQSGLRSLIYHSNRLDLRLSLGASLPVNSDDNDARKGMEDIDLILEAGPTLQHTLFKNDKHLLHADWPIRAAFTLGNQPFNHQGWTTTP